MHYEFSPQSQPESATQEVSVSSIQNNIILTILLGIIKKTVCVNACHSLALLAGGSRAGQAGALVGKLQAQDRRGEGKEGGGGREGEEGRRGGRGGR